jgi:chemotaxis protein MotB
MTSHPSPEFKERRRGLARLLGIDWTLRASPEITLVSTQRLPNNITISGHTDAQPFAGLGGRTNWELSLDRANSARRALVQHGIPVGRISNVIGRADRELLDPGNPESPANRRITVTLLRAAGKEASKAIPKPPRIIRE